MTQTLPGQVEQFRKLHPTLRYDSCSVTPVSDGLRLDYSFFLDRSHSFTPSITIPCASVVPDLTTERLAFLIGMVELMSYWKLTCSPRIEVRAGSLSSKEITFWERLFRNGMGEFFYLNQIPPSIEFEIAPSLRAEPPLLTSNPSNDSFLILVGGGKDSVVTLELLKRYSETRDVRLASFALNPIPASINAIQAARYPSPLVATRQLDPKLLELNAKGYLNGHTPFSALLALVSTLTAHLNRFHYVLASNESSASEGNVSYHGVDINHQYSKSLEFEGLFRDYMRSMLLGIEYSSFLRPINELQICALFATFEHQHTVFRSCNREQTLRARQREASTTGAGYKISGWCAECPKCIFTYLCLSCFLPQERLVEIFGTNPGTTPSFTTIVRELAGFATHKPFECVGTFEEVRASLKYLLSAGILSESINGDLADLHSQIISTSTAPIQDILARWNAQHFVPDELAELLRIHLVDAGERLT
jgi:hypothetical protein